MGANRRGGAVTLVERKSGYLLLAKVPNLQAATVRQAAAQKYATTPKTLRKTLTLDWAAVKRDDQELFVAAKNWFQRWSKALAFVGLAQATPDDGPHRCA